MFVKSNVFQIIVTLNTEKLKYLITVIAMLYIPKQCKFSLYWLVFIYLNDRKNTNLIYFDQSMPLSVLNRNNACYLVFFIDYHLQNLCFTVHIQRVSLPGSRAFLNWLLVTGGVEFTYVTFLCAHWFTFIQLPHLLQFKWNSENYKLSL